LSKNEHTQMCTTDPDNTVCGSILRCMESKESYIPLVANYWTRVLCMELNCMESTESYIHTDTLKRALLKRALFYIRTQHCNLFWKYLQRWRLFVADFRCVYQRSAIRLNIGLFSREIGHFLISLLEIPASNMSDSTAQTAPPRRRTLRRVSVPSHAACTLEQADILKSQLATTVAWPKKKILKSQLGTRVLIHKA